MGSAGPVSRRNRPAKPALSQESIVEAALALLDADGLDAVSMRRVAQALDTGPASLYVYVENRDQLLGLLLDRISGEVRLPTAETGQGWREQLVTLIGETIAVLGRHRGIALIAFANVPTGPNSLALTEAILGLLAESGLSRQTRAWAVDVLALYITAAGTEETIQAEKDGARLNQNSVNLGVWQTFAALSPAQYPNITDLHQELSYGSGAQRSRWSIDVLINGILATAAENETDGGGA